MKGFIELDSEETKEFLKRREVTLTVHEGVKPDVDYIAVWLSAKHTYRWANVLKMQADTTNNQWIRITIKKTISPGLWMLCELVLLLFFLVVLLPCTLWLAQYVADNVFIH